MAITVDIDLETHDFSQFDSTVTDGGDLSVVDGGLAGTGHKLSFLVNDGASMYGTKNFASQSEIRCRFYYDPNAISITSGNFFIHLLGQNNNPWWFMVLVAVSAGSPYTLQITWNTDTNSQPSDTAVLSDAEHCIEYYMHSATTDTSNDGTFEWWIDDISQGQTTGIDNYNLMHDSASIGGRLLAFEYPSGTVSGTYYLDQLIINDDGSKIGLIDESPSTTFSFVGMNAILTKGGSLSYSLLCSTGNFSLTGNDAIELFNRSLFSTVGQFVLTGNNAILDWHTLTNYALWTSVGSFSWVRNNAVLIRSLKILSSPVAFNLTGNDVKLLRNLKMFGSPGSFVWTRNNSIELFNRKILSASGVYTLTGNNSIELWKRLMKTTTGQFTLTGMNAILTWLILGQYKLQTTTGLFALTGTEKLLAKRLMQATTGSFALSSSGERLLFGRTILTAPGQIVFSGENAILNWVRILKLLTQTGQFDWSGLDVIMSIGTALEIYGLVIARDRATMKAIGSDSAIMKVVGGDHG